ncbi:MAG: DUF4116 domain-containing protein [Chlamydiia bacterium]|nr:DUF4116 domain-containing protein [Chlamydiia bacterium]
MVHLIRASIGSIGSNPFEFYSCLSSQVSSFAQSCLRLGSQWVRSDESYSVQWESVKGKFSEHLASAVVLMNKVAQVFSRLINLCFNELHEGYLYVFKKEYHRSHASQTVAGNGLDLQFCSAGSKNNPDVVLAAIDQNVEALAYASDRLKGDRDFILQAVACNPLAVRYACDELKVDEVVIQAALSMVAPTKREAFMAQLFRDKQWVIALMAQHPQALANPDVYREWGEDRDVVLAAVKKDGLFLRYACEALRGDLEVVVAAVNQAPRAREYASFELQWNKKVVLPCLRVCMAYSKFLHNAPPSLTNDKEFMLAAVMEKADALQYASERLRDDKAFMLAAVMKNADALEYVSERFRGDKKIVRAAVTKNPFTLQYASAELKGDQEIVRLAVTKNPFTLEYASERLQRDQEMHSLAAHSCGFR